MRFIWTTMKRPSGPRIPPWLKRILRGLNPRIIRLYKEGGSLIKLTAALRGKAHTLPPQGPFGRNIHDFGPGRGF